MLENSNIYQKIFPLVARIALALIYIWFGVLKLAGQSPAEPLVQDLFAKTIHFMPFDLFYGLFAGFEIVIGLLFLIPKTTKPAVGLFALHMVMTTLPLLILPATSWSGWFVPTLTGQYIIKNIALIACALGLLAYTHQEPPLLRIWHKFLGR